MGVVWRARDERLDRVVAVKQLLLAPGLSAAEAEHSRARAMREARIAARLQHPQAISVFDVALDSGDPWLVMEYLPSASLAAVLDERGPLPPREVARIGRQVAGALTAAHAARIVHRDVKPGNVLLGHDSTVKITDFGISRAAGDVTVTRTGILAGTPAYFAPEVARGEQPTPASDVFSLGSTLYAAVEGQPPFGTDENTLALLRAVADGQVRPPSRAGPLTAPLLQLLQDQAANRPTMSAARDMLGSVADGTDGPDTDTVATVPPLASSPPWWGGRGPLQPSRTATAAAEQPASGSGTSGDAPRWQRPGALLGAAAVLVLALVGIAFALIGTGDNGQQRGVAAAPTTQRATGQQPATAPPAATAPETTAVPPPASETTVASPPPPAPQRFERVVREYYSLLPDNTDAVWDQLGEGVRRQAGGRAGYEEFWSDIDQIRIVGPVEVQGDTVLLNLVFDQAEGPTTYERYRLTMATTPDGRILIQASEPIGRFDPRDFE